MASTTDGIARTLISISQELESRGAIAARIKISRNDPCWCGSGLKYKKCHLGRSEAKAPPFGQIFQAVHKENQLRVCLRAGENGEACKGKLIDAHVVSRSRVLRHLADENSHVLRFNLATQQPARSLEPTPIGTRLASTFPGFCAHHDDTLFSPLEKREFTASAEQCFLLGYRSTCLELYKKQAAIRAMGATMPLMDRGRDIVSQLHLQAFMRGNQHAFELGLKDVVHVKTKYEQDLDSRGANTFDYSWIRYKGNAAVCTALTTQVDIDLDGKPLQNIAAGLLAEAPVAPSQSVQMAIWAEEEHGYVVFSFPKDFNFCADFVRSLWKLHDDCVLDAVLEIAFNYSETTFFSSQWWRSLSEHNKSVIRRAAANIHPHVNGIVRGLKAAVDWKVDERYASFAV